MLEYGPQPEQKAELDALWAVASVAEHHMGIDLVVSIFLNLISKAEFQFFCID